MRESRAARQGLCRSTRAARARAGALALAAALAGAAPPAAAGPEVLDLQGSGPTSSERPVTEGEWARALAEALGLSQALPEEPRPEELFALLCAEKAELTLAAGGQRLPEDGSFRVAVDAPRAVVPGGPVRLVLPVPATALYALTVEGVGRQRWVLDGEPVGHVDPTPIGVAQARRIVALARGPHELGGFLTPGARVDRVELAAHRALCAAPADGWHAERVLRAGALARTLVAAFDFERRLPEREDETRVIEGERFDETSGGGGSTTRRLGMPAQGGAWAAALSSPTEFTWWFELEHPRVVSVEALTHGAPAQLWSIDGRVRRSLHPDGVEAGFAWNHVFTLTLSAGRHAVRALLPRGSGVDALRIVAHRSNDGDYVTVLRGLSLATGASAAPVTRSQARDLLESRAFTELADSFRLRLAGDPRDQPLALVEETPDPLVSRPLSPLLPAEL